MFGLKRVILTLVTVLILHISSATYIHARRHCALGYTALRPFLRRPTVTKRTSREEKKRRSEFHKQLHKELRMKYWERLDPAVNTIIQFQPERQAPIDPKRAFVVQEAIPRLVKLTEQQTNCSLTAEQSEAFDRRAGLKLLCDIKAVFSFIAETINTDGHFKDFKLMASQDQLPKQHADVNYIMSLLKVQTEPEPSTECTEYLGHLAQLAELHPIMTCRIPFPCVLYHQGLALDEEKLPRAPAQSPETCCENEERFFRCRLRHFRGKRHADKYCTTMQKTLNKVATEWKRDDKDAFIDELEVAQQMAPKALTAAIHNPYKASQSVVPYCEIAVA
ncbi:hypothetical protein, conserved [Babesia bigemina]|uniref:Uncharacterized protein n=1 Tax=Babesia bigemina TaxID=5866 RepID=A0A061D2P8_BABBI|nr:hypothetical protein, conserved [Babesia bigemina]CDR94342.1 hypothetical protein, conserved [Babesia bigemina]|eukprot:XP_012766528.1 hypothetical protein, conserved [Babesia bigemina]